MCVCVHRDCDIGVAQDLHHDAQMHRLCDQKRGAPILGALLMLSGRG
jgi:hypothetical protein